MWPEVHRAISKQEAQVVLTALQRAGTGIANSEIETKIPSLVVLAYCPCGCGSVSFDVSRDRRYGLIADGYAVTDDGTNVGVIVWGDAETISGLEIYRADEDDPKLPMPQSVRRS